MVFLRPPLLSTLLLAASATLAHPLTPRAALPTCTQTTSLNVGFTHPGIYHSCASLNRIQSQISAAPPFPPFTDAPTSVTSKSNFLKSSAWSMSGPYAEVVFGGNDGHNIPLQPDGKAAYIWTVVSETSRGSFYNNGKSPVEAIGVGYHQYFRMCLAGSMPKYIAYLGGLGLGLGFDTVEFGDAQSVAALGL
ncbi:hypothetical protein DFP73DRAFT_631996 [Morchella snyderi]|nr:hypothetical protein DFP73DRAFT_631996 [Morchella snyderi]